MRATNGGASVWPTVPADATFQSELLASARYSGAMLSDHLLKYVGVTEYQGNAFGSATGAFVDRAFGGKADPAKIVRQRTPFTFFASFLCASDEAAWLSALITGNRATMQKLKPATKTGRLTAPSYKACPECVAKDRSDFGVGHWHVLHQFPAVTRCPWHRVDLHDQCGGCGAPLGGPRLRRLPGDLCGRCSSARTASGSPHRCSPGYESFEALVTRASTGQVPELRPSVRMRVMDRVVFRRLGERGLQEAVRSFLATWGVDRAGELGRLLGCNVSERLLFSLFGGVDAGCSRYLQAAVLAFALEHATAADRAHCMSDQDEAIGPEDLFVDGGGKNRLDATLVRDLCQRAAKIGYPVEGARALAEGQSARKVAKRGLAAPNATIRFLGSLPQATYACYESLVSRPEMQAATKEALTRESVRERIDLALGRGCKTRVQLSLADQAAYRWALKNDSAWLDDAVPRPTPGSPRAWERAGQSAVRAVLTAAIREGACTRTLLLNKQFRAYRWAFRHDAAWLDGVIQALPKTETGKHKSWEQAGRATVREVLMAAMQGGACTRTLLKNKKSRAYCWALRNDAEWLNSVIESGRKVRTRPDRDQAMESS